MQSFGAIYFIYNAYLHFRCQCLLRVFTYALAPSSVRIGYWQMQPALPGRLVQHKVTWKFRRHHTSYLSHVLSAVNIKSQFYIYFRSRETQLNITSYTCSIGKCQVHIHKAQLFKWWECLIEFSSIYFVFPTSPKSNKEKHRHCRCSKIQTLFR
jgi:hypothetical protein